MRKMDQAMEHNVVAEKPETAPDQAKKKLLKLWI